MLEIAKLFLICAVALAATAFAVAEELPGHPSSSKSGLTIKWIEQKLNHFNESDTRTWQMRYMSNDELYVPGGPLFIHVGGIGSITDCFISSGLFYDTAREHNASLFQTEHRFYGESRPVKDMTIENLQYLDVKQALADLAHFIRTIKSSSASMNNSKVILAGAHYSGSMVTWFKKLYPELAVGCWASSAPLLAKLDFKERKEAVGRSIRLVGGDSCYNRIANGVKEMEKMLPQNRSAEIKRALNICKTFDTNSELDVAVLSSYVFDALEIPVENHNCDLIQTCCKQIMQGSDDFQGLSNYVVHFYDNSSCNNFTYKNEVAAAKVTTFGNKSERQMYYQLCNEFGWFATTTSTQQPFGTKMPLSSFFYICKDVFGDKFTPEYVESQVNKTNQLFGGLNPQVENVYMTHGQLDPWLPLGIQDVNKATIIPMTSHASDLDSISEADSKELKAAKMKFKELVKNWLKN